MLIPVLFPFLVAAQNAGSQNIFLPVPDHIVIVILEDHNFSSIIGSPAAPYINSLTLDSKTALFSQSYGITCCFSQPNYFDLYSGCNQGVLNNLNPPNDPFTTDNLGRQLLDSGRTFITYSEDLPSVGFNGDTWAYYARKHNPAANWMGTGTNQIPDTTNQPFTAFPSSNFALLPTVSYVIPNLLHNMHDGTDPQRITDCDTWLNNNLDSYVQWAKSNNSLFMITFDIGGVNEPMPTLFTGEMVLGGIYSDTVNHYSVLRTIEDMYGLPYACNAATALPITFCWDSTTAFPEIYFPGIKPIQVFPNPSSESITIKIPFEFSQSYNNVFNNPAELMITDITGQILYKDSQMITFINSEINFDISDFANGTYFLQVCTGDNFYRAKFIKM